jgi:ABC-2 type transport system ATP-binding protein
MNEACRVGNAAARQGGETARAKGGCRAAQATAQRAGAACHCRNAARRLHDGVFLRQAARSVGPRTPGGRFCTDARTRGMNCVISVSGLSKTYASGYQALKNVSLAIRRGEIFALLGPNGAGKTTLISIICGIVKPGVGSVLVNGHDIVSSYRAARSMIGLVPQELTTDAFETVWSTVSFSRGLFGKKSDPKHIARVLQDLSLWDRRNSKIITLSGGMKRRVMIAKALAHEPEILFLDEPTAGVDVELRKDMWQLVRSLRASGVTIILTTHYIEEAEQMADRVGVISKGELILVEDKDTLMRSLGKKRLVLELHDKLAAVPVALAGYGLELSADGSRLIYTYDTRAERTGITSLLKDLSAARVTFRDLNTTQSSLEEIFVSLVSTRT